ESDFEYDIVHILIQKDQERHRGDRFEVRRVPIDLAGERELFNAVMDTIERRGKLRRGNRGAIDANALGGFSEVRRREEARAPSCCAQPTFDHGGGRAFAIGTRYVNEAEVVLRIAERGQRRLYSLEAEFGGLDLVAEGVQKLNGIGIVHGAG